MSDPRPKHSAAESSAGFFDMAMADEDTLAGMESGKPLPQETAGTVIAGRYVLKTVLGEGGAGSVWQAEQTRPVRRAVAVKIIRPDLGTGPVSARFIREYQVLARMEHPNIAAVFDAGELPDGRTYFVMEMVAGDAITTWCRKHETPLKTRLEIFVQACLAVQHAHQKGILHRDLKPSNVMVTQVDGKPAVKVIDFGIAKALAGDDLTPGLDMTLRGMVLGTPRYMSPEQAGLTGQDVDTRTDVYALGVLLYELLTGSTPIQVEDEKNAPLQDLLQQVRHTETELPSRRIARASSGEKLWGKELRGELDWIVMRALQKDREQRYPTALALAEDVQRHLRDEPVSAGPPGAAYRVKKWLVRHRQTTLSVAAVFGALSAGVATTWWALDLAEHQRLEAQRLRLSERSQTDLANQVSAQLSELLDSARKHVEAGMNTQVLRKLADECAASLSRFSNQPKTEAQLAEQLAQLYTALEEPARGLPWFQRHWELVSQIEGPDSLAALMALYDLGWRTTALNQPERAAPLLQQALNGLERLPDAAAQPARALNVRRELARALSRLGHHEEAVTLMAAVVSQKEVVSPEEAALWLRDQAEILRVAGRRDESAAALRHSLELIPDDAEHSGLRAYVLASLATTTGRTEDYEASLAASLAHLRFLETELAEGHPRLLHALLEHATKACKVPGCPGGEESARRALLIAQTAGHEARLADAWIMVSETLRMQGRHEESEEVIRQGLEEVARTQAEQWRLLEMHRRLGDLLTARRQYAEAWKEYQTAAKDWFARPVAGRSREKEKLILTSIVKFWELAAEHGSPLADDSQLNLWRTRLQEWEAARVPAQVMN